MILITSITDGGWQFHKPANYGFVIIELVPMLMLIAISPEQRNFILQWPTVKKTVFVILSPPLVHGLLQFLNCSTHIPEPFCQPPEFLYIEKLEVVVGPIFNQLTRGFHIRLVREDCVCLYVVGS